MAESEEELESLLMKVKVESEEVGLLLEYFVSRCKVIKNGKKAAKAE